MAMVEFEVLEGLGLTERVFTREKNGIVTLTFPTTLATNEMAIVLSKLGLGCYCKATVGTRPGFYYGSIYGVLDARQVTNKATVMAWLHRANDSPQAEALRADLDRHQAKATA